MNKKGRGEVESAITLIFGIIITVIILSSGIVSDVFRAFSGFGALSGILAILFLLMIFFSIWEALKRK